MLASVNIGVLLSEKLLPTQGLGLVFTERSEEKGDPHTQTYTERPATNVNTITHTHSLSHTHTQTEPNVDEVAEREGVGVCCSQWEHTQPSSSIVAVIYRGAIRFQCSAPPFCC